MKAALTFIIGRAGTGKTEALYARIREAVTAHPGDARNFLIVPEQASFEAEKALSERLGGGLFGVTVTSWSRLARKALDGMGVKRAFLSPQGRVMLVRRSADACADSLTVFKNSAASRGFPAEMDGLISRFKRCGMCAADVAELAAGLPEHTPLRDKLADVSTVFADCEQRMSDRYIDSEDMMNGLIARMGESILEGARVFIDGGDTMHEQAYPVFRALLGHASEVTAALRMDPDPGVRDRAIFAPEAAAYRRLCAIAEEEGAPYKTLALEKRQRSGGPALRHLEKELFAYPASVYEGEPAGLSLTAAADREDEVTEAAERIVSAAKAGVRFRDMAVLLSDPQGYAGAVQRVFSAYGIPYFTDVKRSLAGHPAAMQLIAALRACDSGFAPEHVLEFVKGGMAPVTPDEAERFENLLLMRGFYGSRLREELTGEDAALEDVRKRVMEPLVELAESVSRRTCEERARAIHAFMERLGVYEKQRELCAGLHEQGLLREEEENAQVVNTILEVLDQVFVIMGDEKLKLSRFISVLREGFAAYEVGVIPTTADQVLVGSMDRTRSREVKKLFVLGMNDGLFPKKRTDDGVIDDSDLAALEAGGHTLWRSSRSLSEGDMHTVYSALSMATESIAFSYPVSIPTSGEDSSAAPCRLVGTLRRIFPKLESNDLTVSPGPRSSEKLAFAALARRLRRLVDTGEEDPELAPLYAHFSRSPEYRARLRSMCAELEYSAETGAFGHELAVKLYGSSIYGSASRLETFNRCPFMHFMRYGLDAKERREHSQRVTDRGTFFHEAIEKYVRYVSENGLDWKTLCDDDVFDILREIVPPIMSRSDSPLLSDTARQRAALVGLVESVKYTCCAVTRHIARGKFRPAGCEVEFGRENSLFPPLQIRTPSGMVINVSGIIDRIDSFEGGDGAERRRIIDYKTGGKDFDFGELEAGIQLQLPLYAAAVDAASTVGMYYMPISDVAVTTDEAGNAVKELTEELMKKFRLSGLSLKDEEVVAATEEFDRSSTVIAAKYGKDGELTGAGLVTGDEYGLVVRAAMDRASHTLERIYEGDAEVHPYRSAYKKRDSACRFCPYGDVCRFDEKLSRGGYRKVFRKSADAFFGRKKD
ncbi:MAG: PD-(D/E)XK nuclease family protein [Clostridia bacterium]|nr:PD-(D/E)XK nuclease family protein [Clostridia bacterium]